MNDLTYFRVVDFETSGFQDDAEVLEMGLVDCYAEADRVGLGCSFLFRNLLPIPPGARAVHHITAGMLSGLPTWDEAKAETWAHAPLMLTGQAPPHRFVAAHSASFEQRWASELVGQTPWLCTYKCAMRLWPDAPTHSNGGLRYWLADEGLWPITFQQELSVPAHRALPDAYVTAHLVLVMLKLATVEQLLEWSTEPTFITRIPFGDQRGRLFSEVDEGLLHWILRKDFSDDVVAATRRELQRRMAERDREQEEDLRRFEAENPRLPL